MLRVFLFESFQMVTEFKKRSSFEKSFSWNLKSEGYFLIAFGKGSFVTFIRWLNALPTTVVYRLSAKVTVSDLCLEKSVR
jgi:hypothetical protein